MKKNHFRKNRIIKTLKPYRRPDCKCYYIRLIGIDGKRSEINLGTADKKEARLRAKREIDKLNSQLDGSFAKIVTVPELIEGYFRSRNNLAETTLTRNKEHVHFFLVFMRTRHPEIKYFSQIHQGHIEGFQNYRLSGTGYGKRKISNKTVKESVYVLNNIFEWALGHNYVHCNPVKRIDKIKVIDKEQHRFSDEEIILILEFCKNSERHKHLYAAYFTLATTGLRSGELSNLMWEDLDFERRVIKIRTKTLPDGREWMTKTKQSRELKMDDEVYNVLFDLKVQSDSQWVFVNTRGKRQSINMLWQNLKSICIKLNIKPGQVHSFRRSFACMMDKAIHDRVAIQETLGHATMTMTDRYCGYRPKEYIDKAHLKTTSEFVKKLKESEKLSA